MTDFKIRTSLFLLITAGLCLTNAAALQHRAPEPTITLEGDVVNISGDAQGLYPRSIVLQDGTLLASYATITHGIQARKSHDQGKTWDDPIIVVPFEAANVNQDNGFLFQKESGELLCAYRSHIHDPDSDTITQLNLDISQSTDGGESWEVYSSILSETPNTVDEKGEWEPFLWYNKVTDKMEVYWAHELNATNQDTVKKISDDGGKTWGERLTMTGASVNARDGMPNMLALDDTGMNLLLTFETNRGGTTLHVWAADSTDGGATWTNARPIYDPEKTTPGRSAGGPGIVNLNGTLIVSFMTNVDAPNGDNYPDAWTDMNVITSVDQGQSWSAPTRVITNATWGGITLVGDGAFVVGKSLDAGVPAVGQMIQVGLEAEGP